MEGVLRILSKEKFAELVQDISRQFALPLLIIDGEGRPVLNSGIDCALFSCLLSGGCHKGEKLSPLPICLNGEEVGKLAVCSAQNGRSENHGSAAYCLQNFLRLEVEVEDLSAEVVRVYEELALIYSLTNNLGSEMDVDSICQRVLEEADKRLSAQNVSIMLLDEGNDELYTRLARGRDREVAIQFRVNASTGPISELLARGEPVTICDITADGRLSFPYPIRSILCVPLVTDGKKIGMLFASDKLSGEEFWTQELKLMGALAAEVAASIKKAQLYEEISELFMHTVEALASAIDAKDPYTYGHSRRVARLSSAICEELGMVRKNIRHVELAAILHDIGKIGTPESILQKPGRLEPEEMERVKEHPTRGAHILSNIIEFRDVIKWIKHHHEWYDGKGYPDHIAAELIPIEARVISIADTFDAMTSDRPYRKGMPTDEAIKIMEQFAGTQFDPHILASFKKICDSGKAEFMELYHESQEAKVDE
jgi:putative nucleotidyltransferase with HDIG domain